MAKLVTLVFTAIFLIMTIIAEGFIFQSAFSSMLDFDDSWASLIVSVCLAGAIILPKIISASWAIVDYPQDKKGATWGVISFIFIMGITYNGLPFILSDTFTSIVRMFLGVQVFVAITVGAGVLDLKAFSFSIPRFNYKRKTTGHHQANFGDRF